MIRVVVVVCVVSAALLAVPSAASAALWKGRTDQGRLARFYVLVDDGLATW